MQTVHADNACIQVDICREKQWGINIKIEDKLTKNGGKIEKFIFPRPLGTIPMSSYQWRI